jgi:protein-disulfide isomerase
MVARAAAPLCAALPDRRVEMPHFRPALTGLALAAGLSLLAAPLAAAEEALTAEQKAAIETLIRDYLLAHPEVVVESLEKYEELQAANEAEQAKQAITDNAEELLSGEGAPVGGNPNASFTVVEFFDYRCPYCKTVAGAFIDTVEEDGDLRIVFKEFPILGDWSLLAAKAALAADKQGKYLPLHRALMEYKGEPTEEAVFDIAAAQGIDVDRLRQDMESPDVQEQLDRNYALARALGVRGTPAFIIGNELVPGALSMDDFKQKVEEQRGG